MFYHHWLYKPCAGSARVTELHLVNGEVPGAEQAIGFPVGRQFLRKPVLPVGVETFPAGRAGQAAQRPGAGIGVRCLPSPLRWGCCSVGLLPEAQKEAVFLRKCHF